MLKNLKKRYLLPVSLFIVISGLCFGIYKVFFERNVPYCKDEQVKILLNDVVSDILKQNEQAGFFSIIRYSIQYIIDYQETGFDKERSKRVCSANLAYKASTSGLGDKAATFDKEFVGKVNYTVLYNEKDDNIYVEASIQE